VRREQRVSGGMTAAERALGFPKNILATHTEARACDAARTAQRGLS
jgi:hypothetical protein